MEPYGNTAAEGVKQHYIERNKKKIDPDIIPHCPDQSSFFHSQSKCFVVFIEAAISRETIPFGAYAFFQILSLEP